MSSRREGSALGRLLEMLKENEGRHCPGPDLAERLGLSRTGIWKHVQALKARGYEIESHAKEGYMLVKSPDLLTPEEVAPYLKTAWLGRRYHHFAKLGSTNDQALLFAGEGAPHGTVTTAEEQTAGRGRLRRPWESPPGCGIYMSMLLEPPIAARDAPQVILVSGLALVKTLSEEFGLSAQLKWPNDVLIGGKKISGMLAEMQSDQDAVRFLVIGVGINVNHRPEDMPETFRYPATSLAIELGRTVKRRDVLAAFLERFEREYERFVKEGLTALLPELEGASGVIGKVVTLLKGEEQVSGVVTGFTAEGALLLADSQGREEIVWVGDITRVEGFH